MPELSEEEIKRLAEEAVRRIYLSRIADGTYPPSAMKMLGSDPEKAFADLAHLVATLIIYKQKSGTPATQEDIETFAHSLLPVSIRVLSNAEKSWATGTGDHDHDGALLFCRKGEKLLKAELYSDAKRFFKRAIQIKQDLKTAWLGLSEAQEKLGEVQEAENSRQIASELS
jgi:uncharacterized protein HemY